MRPRHWVEPEIKGVNLVRDALVQDSANQRKKYGGEEPSPRAARFHVALPTVPQHNKYSQQAKHEVFGSVGPGMCGSRRRMLSVARVEVESLAIPSNCRFDMQRLSKWFREIDAKKSGRITQRELIVSLRRHQGIQALFCMSHGLEYRGEVQAGTAAEIATRERRDEILRIKEILREVDADNSGTMEWEEFVDFFRRAGLLLEYEENSALNRSSLCTTGDLPTRLTVQEAQKELHCQHQTTTTYTPVKFDNSDLPSARSPLSVDSSPIRKLLESNLISS